MKKKGQRPPNPFPQRLPKTKEEKKKDVFLLGRVTHFPNFPPGTGKKREIWGKSFVKTKLVRLLLFFAHFGPIGPSG